ncbi:MAG TPA: mechanosensitive ion channel family protein, partial [Geobacteraceae bacterium]|nr:mechanosensitive ion channel family protein [Geobacteraceae bacterium]
MDRILDFYRLQEYDSLTLFWLKEILVAVLIFAAFWLLAKLLNYLIKNWVPRFTALTRTDLDDRIIRRITPPASLFVILAGLYFAVKSLPFPEKVQTVTSGV